MTWTSLPSFMHDLDLWERAKNRISQRCTVAICMVVCITQSAILETSKFHCIRLYPQTNTFCKWCHFPSSSECVYLSFWSATWYLLTLLTFTYTVFYVTDDSLFTLIPPLALRIFLRFASSASLVCLLMLELSVPLRFDAVDFKAELNRL